MNTRLAIGSFGLGSDQLEGELADLITARLSALPELELVERRELNKVLHEATLSLAGLQKPKDAVRIGALVRADQFLLGTAVVINGTNRCIVRLVDARSGTMRAINVFSASQSLDVLAVEISGFVSAELGRPLQEPQDYVAIGVIQHLGVNDRFRDFPAQMRGVLAANLRGKATVLERDVVSFLANEVRLNLTGLTEATDKTNAQVQFGFWIVDAFYQSHEVAKPVVELKLRVERVQGKSKTFSLQGEPNDHFFQKISGTIEAEINRPEAVADSIPPTRKAEIAALEKRGRELVDYDRMTWMPRGIIVRNADSSNKEWATLDEARRVYEAILLLDPDNVPAKMRLAACLLFDTNPYGNIRMAFPADNAARATDLYADVIASGDPEYTVEAQICFAVVRGQLDGVKLLRRYANETLDPEAKAQLRAYASDFLGEMQHRLPIEHVLEAMRAQVIDELAEVEQKTNKPFIVSFEDVLFAYRFHPEKRREAINALLPDLLEKFPKLTPYILLAAACEQTDHRSPVLPQFLASLKECEAHPEKILQPTSYFTHLSTTAESEKAASSGWRYARPYESAFENGQHSIVVAMALARQRAAEKGLAPPLTNHGKRILAQSYGALGQWQQALDIYVTLPDVSPQVINECRKHLNLSLVSEAVPDSAWKDKGDKEKVKIAYECIEREQWLVAAAIFDSIRYRTVRMSGDGPWGRAFVPILPALRANECRVRAGSKPVNDPLLFELGDRPYIQFSSTGSQWFVGEAEGDDVWIATYNEIKRFSGPGPFNALNPVELHDVDRVTGGIVTSICVGPDFIWVGTADDGLFELNRKTGDIRHMTMKEGLFLNRISHLHLRDKTLWISYQNGEEGAVGTMDLQTHKFSTFTPNLQLKTDNDPKTYTARMNQPPEGRISCMTSGASEEMWFGVVGKGVQSYTQTDDRWKYVYNVFPRMTFLLSMAVDPVHGRLLVAAHDSSSSFGNEKSTSGGLYIYDYKKEKHEIMRIDRDLPANDLSAVAVDGNIAWIGGRGFVAVVDIEERKILRIAYLSANGISRIQIGKTHVWIHVNPGKDGDAPTGIYRLQRSAIEPIKK